MNVVYDQISEILVEIEIKTKERNYGRVLFKTYIIICIDQTISMIFWNRNKMAASSNVNLILHSTVILRLLLHSPKSVLYAGDSPFICVTRREISSMTTAASRQFPNSLNPLHPVEFQTHSHCVAHLLMICLLILF